MKIYAKKLKILQIYEYYYDRYYYCCMNRYYDYKYNECESRLISYFFEKSERVLRYCGPKFVIILICFILSLILILLWIFYYICCYKKLCCFNKHAKINCNKKFIYIFIFILNIILITGSIYCIILTHKFYINTNRITCSVFKLYDHLKNGDDKYRNEIGRLKWQGIQKINSTLNQTYIYSYEIQEKIKILVEKNSLLNDYLNDYIKKIESFNILHPNFETNDYITPIYINELKNIKDNEYLSDIISFIDETTNSIKILSNDDNISNLRNALDNYLEDLYKICKSFKEYNRTSD